MSSRNIALNDVVDFWHNVSELFSGILALAMNIFTLQKDVKQIQSQDPLYTSRGYFDYVVTSLASSFSMIQAIYSYVVVVNLNRFLWQSASSQLLLICLICIFSFACPLTIILTGFFHQPCSSASLGSRCTEDKSKRYANSDSRARKTRMENSSTNYYPCFRCVCIRDDCFFQLTDPIRVFIMSRTHRDPI